MQKNVVIPQNRFIEDLGSGFTYVNLYREEIQIEDELGVKTVIVAGEQYKVRNPATKDRIINIVISENYADGKSEAALRKGIIDKNNPDFVSFNEFAEAIKAICHIEGVD